MWHKQVGKVVINWHKIRNRQESGLPDQLAVVAEVEQRRGAIHQDLHSGEQQPSGGASQPAGGYDLREGGEGDLIHDRLN